jgi:hypothetical protein
MMARAAVRIENLEGLAPQLSEVITLLDLVAAVAESAENDEEVVATVRSLINSGKVSIVGNFGGADVRVG